MATTENIALANTIDKVKNYVDDPNNLYGVLRAGLLTGDLDTPFVQFVGASTMSYPVFPKNTTDLPDYSKTGGYTRVNVDYDRKEVTVSQNKGYQIGVDRLDLEDGHLTSIMIINNQVRQMEIPTLDKYRLNKLATATGVTSKEITLGTDDPLAVYDEAIQTLKENEIPVTNTILYCTPAFYTALKNSDKVRRAINVQVNNGEVNREVLIWIGLAYLGCVCINNNIEKIQYILQWSFVSVACGIVINPLPRWSYKTKYKRVKEELK